MEQLDWLHFCFLFVISDSFSVPCCLLEVRFKPFSLSCMGSALNSLAVAIFRKVADAFLGFHSDLSL